MRWSMLLIYSLFLGAFIYPLLYFSVMVNKPINIVDNTDLGISARYDLRNKPIYIGSILNRQGDYEKG